MQSLYKDEGIQKAASQRHRYQIMDSFFYYMDNIERIGAPDYIPTDQVPRFNAFSLLIFCWVFLFCMGEGCLI